MQIDRIRRDASPAHKEYDFDPEDEELRTVFCANLSENVTDEVLYELFIQSGPVESVCIPRDKDNRPRGFGFVTFVHSVTVPYAIALYSGVRLFNRDLILRFCNSKIAGSCNQTPTGRPRNDNKNFNSRENLPRSRPSRSNRSHNQNNPYYNKRSQQNSSRGKKSGRHGNWDRPSSNQGQNQRRRR